MQDHVANLVQLYLPLLSNPQKEVRSNTWMILQATYGERALTMLRRMLTDPNPTLRQQSLAALKAIAAISDMHVEIRPFEGMYVECLGRLRVYIGNRQVQVQDWAQLEGGRAGWQKVQSVFAYLVHCGRRGATREALAAAVWRGQASAVSVSRTLTALRQTLASVGGEAFMERALTTTREHCILDPATYESDVALFERTFDAALQAEETDGLDAAAPLYTQALQLYGGPYLADVVAGSPWSQERRTTLQNSFILTVERLAEHAYTHDQFQRCLTLCQQALDADPAADDVTAWLLQAYARLGMPAAYEHAYRRYLRLSGIDPHSREGQHDIVVQTYQQATTAPEVSR